MDQYTHNDTVIFADKYNDFFLKKKCNFTARIDTVDKLKVYQLQNSS